jgi:hypothetical protein
MDLTLRNMHSPLTWRNCPSCHQTLVDDEILEDISYAYEPGAFHSNLLGGRNSETGKIEYWKCPHCHSVFVN